MQIQCIPTPVLYYGGTLPVPPSSIVIVDPAGFVLGDPAGDSVGGL